MIKKLLPVILFHQINSFSLLIAVFHLCGDRQFRVQRIDNAAALPSRQPLTRLLVVPRSIPIIAMIRLPCLIPKKSKNSASLYNYTPGKIHKSKGKPRESAL